MKEDENRERGEVWDLVEKLEGGEIKPEEIVREMKTMGLLAHAGEPFPGVFSVTGVIVWGVLCFLPAISKLSKLEMLSFLAQLPSMDFHSLISYLAIILAIVALYLWPYAFILRWKKGGTGTDEHTIFLLRDGPYGIVRHPEFCACMIWFITFPVIFAWAFPFTVLSVLGDVTMILGLFLQSRKEEEFNLRKWGDEYRQYMKEVPRFNFILGIMRRIKRS